MIFLETSHSPLGDQRDGRTEQYRPCPLSVRAADVRLAACLIRDLEKLSVQGVPQVDLVVLSGDIAETGRRSEYAAADAFVRALLDANGLPPERLVLVPGNHDCNWDLSRAYMNDCLGEETEPRPPFARKWRHYQNFVTSLQGETAFTEERPYRLQRFEDLGVVVAALNSTMPETHEKHEGRCGREQLQWFADELSDVSDAVRVAVLHHNVRRRAQNDDENLQDEDDLTTLLGGSLDLVLHGHTHEGKEDRLADGTLVLATGSAALVGARRPQEVPNQYQVLQLGPGRVTSWARQWDGQRRWIADPRASSDGSTWPVYITLPSVASRPNPLREDREARTLGLVERQDEFVAQVELVTRHDLGGATTIERRRKGSPPLDYLIALSTGRRLRCVGVVDGQVDEGVLDRFSAEVFEPLRERGAVEFVVVHPGPDEPALRAEARRRGVFVQTWTEYNDLLDPSAYRTWLRAELEADRGYPQDLYQPQRFRDVDRFGVALQTPRTDLLHEVYDAVLDEDERFLLVLGDAGYGKSFLVRRLADELLQNPLASVTPIVIYLRDRDKRQSLEEMVSAALLPSRSSFHPDRFRHSLEAGALALLLDGYDEFAVRVGYTNAAAQLRTFVDALSGRAKVLLTTRPNHFRSTDEVTSKLFEGLRTVHHGRVYMLEPFDAKQQRAFLRKWFELRGDSEAAATAGAWMSALENVESLPDLAKTPRMLSFIVQDLALEDLQAVAGRGVVTAAELYQRLVERWLGEEASKSDADDRRSVSAASRQRLLEDVALRLWRMGERDLTEDVLQQTVREALDLPRLDLTLDQAAQLVGGRTLLHVDGARWRFNHQSVWEFLLARRIADLLRQGQNDDLLGEAELTDLTIRFLRELAPREAEAWAVRVAGERERLEQAQRAGAGAELSTIWAGAGGQVPDVRRGGPARSGLYGSG